MSECLPFPAELGRGVIVNGDALAPAPWTGAPEIHVRDASAVDALHDAWLTRTPVVVRLHIDPATFRAPANYPVEPWKVSPSFDPVDDRLHFLVWANNYDARNGDLIWWWSRKAERLGAEPCKDRAAGDVIVNGTPVWIDGGPRQPLSTQTIHRETIDLQRLTLAPRPSAPMPDIVLAPDQLAAVSHRTGPARIIAPAGSGKTRVLTERLRYLLGQQRVESESVVTIAYNKKAQEELADRTRAFRPRVLTLNALGWELLGRPVVAEEREVRRIIERLVPTPKRRSNTDPIGPYLEGLSRIRMGLIDPYDAEQERDDVPGLADAFAPFRSQLKERQLVDFDEQIYGAIERLMADGEFRREVQTRFRHLLVDEFQDLTPAHVLMVRLLSAPELDVFGVGDDDQVIYGHAGADPAFLVNFAELFPGAVSHPLTVNYRCPVAVVDGARHLLSYNHNRVAKEIHAGPDAAPEPSALTIRSHAAELGGECVLGTVRVWIAEGRAPTDIAVLARVNSLLLAPQVALTTAGIPVATTLDARVLDRTGARAALAYLRIATAEEGFSRDDVLEVMRRPSRGLPIWIEKWFRTPTLQLHELRSIGSRLDDPKVTVKLDGLTDDIEALIRAAPRSTSRQLLKIVKDRVGLGQAMGLLDASSAAGSHLDDLEALEQVADLHPDPTGFEPWLRSVLSLPSDVAGVTLSTIHRVKGREWPMVALFGVSDGIVPHRLADDIEEERRVLHVGITRAHVEAVVLADTSRPSPFLAELDGRAPHTKAAPKRTGITATPTNSTRTTTGPANAKPAFTGDPTVLESLRSWRTQRAKADKVPPYVILHDRHLQALADAQPKTLRELATIEGMGPTRLERYADELLALLQ